MTCRCRSGECDPECDGLKLRAEVERLTTENADLQRELSDTLLGPTMVQNMRAEVERLLVQVEAERSRAIYLSRRAGEAEAEVERLRAERDEGARWRRQGEAELRAEVEQLTALLGDVMRCAALPVTLMDEIRRALEPKP
jgi:regulator of protease activity HflC (stomatin/prohibitin superfamily)